jgi:DNA-binding response OmpR family regulator
MLTANALPESMTEANNLGATEYLKKPFSPERLLQTIKSFLPLPQSPSAIEEQSYPPPRHYLAGPDSALLLA